MPKSKKNAEGEVSSTSKLTLGELFKQSGVKLSVFVGTLVNAGLQIAYEEEVLSLKKGNPSTEFMSLEEFEKEKKLFLNKET